jgi:kynurenine formamidase
VARFVDRSHEIRDGLVTYPGLAAPTITSEMTFDASHVQYADGYEFQIDRIDMIANTGTYIDTPAHRVRNGPDLADLELATVAGLPVVVVRIPLGTTTIELDVLTGRELTGMAVIFATGWDRHWETAAYGVDHPHLAVATAHALVAGDVALVGIDSLNVDGTTDGTRPIHTAFLEAGIPILEHLTNLAAVPDTGATLYAVPPKVRGMGSFPVRAFCVVA